MNAITVAARIAMPMLVRSDTEPDPPSDANTPGTYISRKKSVLGIKIFIRFGLITICFMGTLRADKIYKFELH